VTELVARDGLPAAGFLRRLGVRLHLLYCQACRRYVRQLRALGAAARRLAFEEGPEVARLAELERAIRTRSGSGQASNPEGPES
jgi:hypothetical protein